MREIESPLIESSIPKENFKTMIQIETKSTHNVFKIPESRTKFMPKDSYDNSRKYKPNPMINLNAIMS